MALLDKANLIIYRIREKGLEVFLVNPSEKNQADETWTLPQGKINDPSKAIALLQKEQTFELDPVENVAGEAENAIAMLKNFALLKEKITSSFLVHYLFPRP